MLLFSFSETNQKRKENPSYEANERDELEKST